MYRLNREDYLKFPLIFLWSLLGFQAGFINSFGFLACGRYVSHVTGFGTQIGMAIAGNKLQIAFELIGFPLSFILGAFFSGFFTSARREQGLKPRYDMITLLFPVIVATVTVLGFHGIFGPFGEALLNMRDFILLYVLSFACGLQNGCFATLTNGQIRTTHLTGISTDIGTDLARQFFGKLPSNELALVKKANLTRIATFTAFSLGSIISVHTSESLQYASLIVPFLTSVIAFYAVMKISSNLDMATRNFKPKMEATL